MRRRSMYTRKGKERKDKERRPAVSLLDSDDEERTRRGANLWSFRTRQAAADWNNLPDAGAQRAAERDGWLVPSRNRKNCRRSGRARYLASPVHGTGRDGGRVASLAGGHDARARLGQRTGRR